MRQRLAFVGEQQRDVAGLGLALAQLEAQADAINLARDLAPLQGVARPTPAKAGLS
jgi:hypothetical protein